MSNPFFKDLFHQDAMEEIIHQANHQSLVPPLCGQVCSHFCFSNASLDIVHKGITRTVLPISTVL